MSTESPLDLNIPEQTGNGADRGHLVDPRKTGVWIQDLPLANIGETARRIYGAVTELNRITMPDVNRIKVAEQLREPVTFIAQNLQTHYMDAPFPLQPRVRKIALLNRALHNELAVAYKIIIAGRARAGALRGKTDRKLLAIAGVRALRALHSLVLHAALVYEPAPEGTWREMHRIFGLLDAIGLRRISVKDPSESGRGSITAEELYRRSLLFSLVSPYRMRQREMVALERALPEWGQHTALTPLSQVRPGEHAFVIDPQSDEPAVYRTLAPEDVGAKGYVFRTEPLALRVRRLVEDADNTDQRTLGGSVLPKPLLRQLAQAWGSAPKRQFVRTRLNFDLELTIGLDDVHELLRGLALQRSDATEPQDPSGDDDTFEALGQFTARLTGETGSPFDLDIADEDSVFLHAQSTVLDSDSGPSWSAAPDDRDAPRTYTFRTVNESAGGYCISWQGDEVPRVKVGEVIGIRSVKSPSQFAIAVIRWMKNEHDEGQQLGIQMLASDSSAAEVQPSGKPNEAPRRAILLPPPRGSDGPAGVLVPPLAFKAGQTVLLIEGGQSRKARLAQLVETTGAFSQFQLQELKRPSVEPSSPVRGDEPFDSLWDDL
ncbi:MAG: hypothetical protein PVF91_15650 [Chromatiales bacterium]